MKRITIGVICLVLISLTPAVNAQKQAGYSSGAYSELGADDTYLDRVSDWFATVGKSREEKILIKSRRRSARKMENMQKEIARKRKEIEKKKKKAMQQYEESKKRANQ